MSDVAIRARDLTKVYRLYSRQRHRLLDMLGVLPARSGAYRDHTALDRVSLDIRRGEKVGIIGRNGAGKSTFLKLVSQVIEPTSGTLDVVPRVHALLQIGTGFHPDFTGRQNVSAYLAQLDITGAAADRLFRDIVDFAELEEYIDQPVKTYSTGMAVRLMFSTSTAIEPELLLLDEVLGVGDAYFSQKSFDRIRQLCAAKGTTLLLVTHDVYAAARLCDRIIWIDRGQAVLDGPGPQVVRAYEDSIRVQEERRLRLRRLILARTAPDENGPATAPLLIEIGAVQNVPQPCPVYFRAIEARRGGEVVARLPLAETAGPASGASSLDTQSVAWGAATEWHGAATRPMLNYGTPFHRVAGVLAVPGGRLEAGAPLELRLSYWADEPCALQLRAFADGWEADYGTLPQRAGGWTDYAVRVDAGGAATPFVPDPNAVGSFGAGDVQILGVSALDAARATSDVLRHGEAASIVLRYVVRNPQLRERAQVIIAFHRDGVQDVCRLICRDLLFDAAAPRGEIEVAMPRVDLTDGRYALTAMIARAGYYDERQTTFFTINPGVYSCLSKSFELNVIGAGYIGEGTVAVADGTWTLRSGA